MKSHIFFAQQFVVKPQLLTAIFSFSRTLVVYRRDHHAHGSVAVVVEAAAGDATTDLDRCVLRKSIRQ